MGSGFSVSACPQVEHVGKIVTAEAISWISIKGEQSLRYKIGGIYPIDHNLRELKIEESFKSVWKDLLLEFRKKYLEGVEWMLVLGGNDGTYEVTRSFSIRCS